MKVSIVIPFVNEIIYVKDCLESLKNQVTDLEVLLVCDHFEGDIEEIVGEYRSFIDIKVFHMKDKSGVAAARNMGLDNAIGEYVYFLDCDDYILDHTIKKLLEVAEQNGSQLVMGMSQPTWYKRSFFLDKEQTVESEDGDSNEEENLETEDTDEAKVLVSDINYKEDTKEVVLAKKRNLACRYMITKKNEIQSISVLNILFSRSWIEENQFRFPEQLRYYSDLPFIIQALFKAERIEFVEEKWYIKRKHNDPINSPSLMQVIDKNKVEECLQAYNIAISKISEYCDVRIRLDKKMIHYYTVVMAPMIRRNDSKLWRVDRFQAIREIIGGMSQEVILSVNRYKRRLIKALKQDNVEKTIKIISRHSGFQMFSMLIKSWTETKKYIYKKYFVKKPLLENTVLLESFFGKSYSDSPKYLYEYLSEHYPGRFRYVWIMEKKKKDIPYNAIQIKRFSLKYFYYFGRAKYIIFNSRQPKYFIKRKGNVFLETWHGTPLKKLVFDMEEVTAASPLYKEQFYVQSRSWDYLIAANYFSADIFRRAFMFDKKMLEFGYPRNDILYRPDKDEIAEKLKASLGIPKDKKVILYAPTWRDDEFHEMGKYKFELKLNITTLRKTLGDEYVIMLRTHYFISDQIDTTGMEGFVFNMSKYDDIAELYLISDVLITDYSSVFFDFANLKRPMLFYTYDFEKYRDVLRGFYFNMNEELPGPLLFTTEEVVDSILNIDTVIDDYKDKYEAFYTKFCGLEDGHASKNVVKEVFKL